MTARFRVKAYLALELELGSDHLPFQAFEPVTLAADEFADSADDSEIPLFLHMLDRETDGLDMPAIRRTLIQHGYPTVWWPEEEAGE